MSLFLLLIPVIRFVCMCVFAQVLTTLVCAMYRITRNIIEPEIPVSDPQQQLSHDPRIPHIQEKAPSSQTRLLDDLHLNLLLDESPEVSVSLPIRIEPPNQRTLPQITTHAPTCAPWAGAEEYGSVVGYSHTVTEHCAGPACRLNLGREPVQYRPHKMFECGTVETCVTLTIKTRYRHKTLLMYLKGVRRRYPNMKVIIMDEIGMNVTETADRAFLDSVVENVGDNYVYLQAQPGVGHGRHLAVRIATTKYVLVSDDDFFFFKSTNLEKLLEVLESTDLGIVGGETSDMFPFSGVMRVARVADDNYDLVFFHNVHYERIPCFSSCFVVDQIKTFFMANRKVILQAGSWDVSRKFYEHEDFFLQMRHSGVKVAVCKDVKVRHMFKSSLKDHDLAPLRKASAAIWKKHLLRKWALSDLYFCPDEPYIKGENGTCLAQQRRYVV